MAVPYEWNDNVYQVPHEWNDDVPNLYQDKVQVVLYFL